MIMVAVKHFDIDSGFRHPARQFPKLPWNILLKPLHQNVGLFVDSDSSSFERPTSGVSVVKKKVGDTTAANHPRAAAFNAYAGASQCFAHFGQGSRPILQMNFKVLQCAPHTLCAP